MRPINKIMAGAIATLCMTAPLFAGNMPFPQNKDYGLKPQGSPKALAAAVEKQYQRYIDTWWRDEGYVYSTDTHKDGLTVSEAHGYGMIIFAIMDDKAKFDKMVSYYEARKASGTDLMLWKIGGGWNGDGSATDGDLDMAFAFLLADQQWGGNGYKDKALRILEDIWQFEVNSQNMPYLGNQWTDQWLYRPSDWMAGHFDVFAGVTSNNWSDMATKVYDNYWYFQEKNPTADGLISDFVKDGEAAYGGENSTTDYHYSYNACRVPLRFAMDYARNKNQKNTDALSKIMGRLLALTDGDASTVKAGYKLDGTPINDFNGLEFLGPYGAGLISTGNATAMNSAWSELQQDWTTDGARSFGDALKLLSMLVMSGNWWTYGDDNTWKNLDYVDTNGVVLDNFGNGFGDDNAQSELGAVNGVYFGDQEYGIGGGDTTFYRGGGYWYTYAGSGARVKGAAGNVIDSETNGDEIVTDNRLDVTFEIDADDKNEYDFAALEVELISDVSKDGEAKSRYVDISKMSGITIQYKSDKAVKLVIATKDERERVTPDGGWTGSYQMSLPANEEMKRVTFDVADIKAEAYSPLEKMVKDEDPSLTGLKEAIAFSFQVGEDADKGNTVHLQVEDIIFNGLTYSDFGIAYREPSPSSIVGVGSKDVGVQTAVTADAINLTFPAAQAGIASVSLFTLNGREMVSRKASVGAGVNSMNINTANLATGVYLMRINLNGVTTSTQISVR